jgi:hypothetical protein
MVLGKSGSLEYYLVTFVARSGGDGSC